MYRVRQKRERHFQFELRFFYCGNKSVFKAVAFKNNEFLPHFSSTFLFDFFFESFFSFFLFFPFFSLYLGAEKRTYLPLLNHFPAFFMQFSRTVQYIFIGEGKRKRKRKRKGKGQRECFQQIRKISWKRLNDENNSLRQGEKGKIQMKGWAKIEKERKGYIQKDWQTVRQTDRQTHKHTRAHKHTHTHIYIYILENRQTKKQTGR